MYKQNHLPFLDLAFLSAGSVSSVQYSWTFCVLGGLPLSYFFLGSAHSSASAQHSSSSFSILRPLRFSICQSRLRAYLTFMRFLEPTVPRMLRSSLWKTYSYSRQSIRIQIKQCCNALLADWPPEQQVGAGKQQGQQARRAIENNINYNCSRMRPGHRRTQSANFIATLPEQQPIKQNGRAKGSKSSIPQLLTQCQLNAHHKICNVDSLHAQIKDEDKMFNFGKGLSKLELRPKSRRDQPLVSIPEKGRRTAARQKKEAELALAAKCKQQSPSVLKVSNRQDRTREEAINKIIKLKIEALQEGQRRKLSVYDGEFKSASRQHRHKKELSTLK